MKGLVGSIVGATWQPKPKPLGAKRVSNVEKAPLGYYVERLLTDRNASNERMHCQWAPMQPLLIVFWANIVVWDVYMVPFEPIEVEQTTNERDKVKQKVP